jgi:hypothetical protein
MKALGTFVIVLAMLAGAAARGDDGALEARVVDVSVFEDGSGVFRFEGEGIVKDGGLTLDDLPMPAFGTLWFYSLDDGVTVKSVNSRESKVEKKRPIADSWTLLKNNPGKNARIVMKDGEKNAESGVATDWEIEGKIVSVSPDGQVFLETVQGVIACAVRDMRYVVVAEADTSETYTTDTRSIEVLLDGAEDGQAVRVGFSCLARGISWLAAYRMDLGEGKAQLALSASVINNAVDIASAQASFVVGAPVFALARQLSPLAQSNKNMDFTILRTQRSMNSSSLTKAPTLDELIQQNEALLAANMQGAWGEVAMSWDNVYYGHPPAPGAAVEKRVESKQLAGVAGNTAEALHLFYYTADEVTVDKDTSSDVILWTAENPVESLFVWNVSAPKVYQNPSYAKRLQDIYAGGLFSSKKVKDDGTSAVKYEKADPPSRCLKLVNETEHPWAAAPLMVYEDGRALGQIWLRYTPAGQETQVVVGPSPDVITHAAQCEIARQLDADTQFAGQYDMLTIEGSLKIENTRDEAATVEVRASYAGTPLWQDKTAEVATERRADTLNPLTTIKWEVTVEPGKEKTLTYRYTALVRH